MKFLISLGPNCDDARVRATSVIENTVPATPIIAPDMVESMLLADAELDTKNNRFIPLLVMFTKLSKYTKPAARIIEKSKINTGTSQNVVFNSFQENSNFFI
jgi:hypothetical protein